MMNEILKCPKCGNDTFKITVPEKWVVIDQIEGIVCTKCGCDIDET